MKITPMSKIKRYLQTLGLALVTALPAASALADFGDNQTPLQETQALNARTKNGITTLDISPESERKKALLRWKIRFAEFAKGVGKNGQTIPFAWPHHPIHLTPQQRLSILDLMKSTLEMQPDGCARLISLTNGNPAPWFAKASVEQIDTIMQLMLAELQATYQSAPAANHYTMEELLEATAYFNQHVEALLTKAFADQGKDPANHKASMTQAQKTCLLSDATVKVVNAAPPELRDRLSWDLVANGYNGGVMVTQVLLNPAIYAIDAFDQSALPHDMQSQLPAPGSHPLPFKRIAMLARFVSSKKMSRPDVKLRYTFINTQNSGVVLKLEQSRPFGSNWSRVTFESDLGLLTMKTQEVMASMQNAGVGLLPLSAYGQLARAIPELGGHYDVATPIPNYDDTTLQHCEITGQYEAKRIVAGLTGKAMEVSCIEFIGDKLQDHAHLAYLVDYGIELSLDNSDPEYGDSTVEYDSVEIVQ